MISTFKMEQAFAAGYDPALELAQRSHSPKTVVADVGTDGQEEWADLPSDWNKHLRRKEQDLVDRILSGIEAGRYYVLIGCKVHSISNAPCCNQPFD